MRLFRHGGTEARRTSGTRVSPWLRVSVAIAAVTVTAAAQRPAPPFSVVEATIADMQAAMAQGRVTSRDIVQQSLTRIALYEERVNAVLAVNPRALEDADARDRERRAGNLRGP